MKKIELIHYIMELNEEDVENLYLTFEDFKRILEFGKHNYIGKIPKESNFKHIELYGNVLYLEIDNLKKENVKIDEKSCTIDIRF